MPSLPVEKDQLLAVLDQLIADMRRHKPEDRSVQDRYFAMVITLLEQAAAVYARHL